MHGFLFRRLVSPQFTHYAESPPRRLELQSELANHSLTLFVDFVALVFFALIGPPSMISAISKQSSSLGDQFDNR